MTVIRPNSVSGITSITAQANEINFFRSNGTLAGLQLNGVNFNTTTGITTLAALKITGNLDVAGVLTYQDVTNVDSIGIITARSGVAYGTGIGATISSPATNTLALGTNGAERLRITSAGKIGIGTDTFIDGNTKFEVRGKTSNTSAGGQNIHKYGSASAFHYGQYNSTGDASLNNQANALLAFATNNTTRMSIASDGATSFYSPAVAWKEGPVVLEASNGYSEIFFRSTGSEHGTSVTGTWSVGKLAGTDGFGILKETMTGGGAVRADAVLSADNSGYITFGKTTRSPKLIRFLVRAGRGGDGRTDNPYQFHTVIQNETSGFSGGWDTVGKTKFTAPVTGFYYFSTHAAYGQNGVSFGTRLLRYNSSNSLQDTYELYRFIQGSAGSHYGGAGSIALPLDAGDYVLLQPQYTPYHLNDTLNFFCGFLIG